MTSLAEELVEIVRASGDVSVILGDSDDGGWLQLAIESEHVVLRAAIPTEAEQDHVRSKLAEAGLAVDDDRGQAQMLCAASAATGSEEELLREAVTVSLALLEHAYGFTATQDLRWLY